MNPRRCPYKGMPAADYVRIDITDTGTGIPADIVDKIFEPFFSHQGSRQGHRALVCRPVYGIVKQTGGFVYVDSEAGQGTSFRIFLPRHRPELEAAPEPQATNGAAKEAAQPSRRSPEADLTGQGTILLVEDEDGLRSLNARGFALARLQRDRGRQRHRGDGSAGREERRRRSASFPTW